ncbi:MAG TPA: ABC transporter permease subunit [Dongiaceae bacterium]|nr:ABC transporter permease subunit [Dongiaceae bacterium]
MSVAELNAGTLQEVKGRSLWANAAHRFMRNKAAVTSVVVFCLIVIACYVVPYLGLRAPDDPGSYESWAAPDWETGYLLGTDANGRDLFVRTLYGGQISLLVGFTATLVSLIIGVVWGATAGFVGGRVDGFMMRIVDILYSIPFIFFVIMLTVLFERKIWLIYVAIGAVSWLDMARIVRGQTISIRRKEYIEAAEASGVSTWRIITRHIIPNTLGPVVVYVTLTVPNVILTESFISYLGMGAQEPDSSWGTLVSEAAVVMELAPWAIIGTASFLAVTLLCLNFIGDGMRDALDPKDR